MKLLDFIHQDLISKDFYFTLFPQKLQLGLVWERVKILLDFVHQDLKSKIFTFTLFPQKLQPAPLQCPQPQPLVVCIFIISN